MTINLKRRIAFAILIGSSSILVACELSTSYKTLNEHLLSYIDSSISSVMVPYKELYNFNKSVIVRCLNQINSNPSYKEFSETNIIVRNDELPKSFILINVCTQEPVNYKAYYWSTNKPNVFYIFDDSKLNKVESVPVNGKPIYSFQEVDWDDHRSFLGHPTIRIVFSSENTQLKTSVSIQPIEF